MQCLKKTLITALVLGSSTVCAGSMGPVCTQGNVLVPCEQRAWDVGIQALYLQPEYTGFDYATQFTNASGSITHNNALDPQWGWGFKLEGSYHFNTGNDLNVNWYYLNNSGESDFTSVDFLTQQGAFPGRLQLGTVWDAVNVEFGQLVEFSKAKQIRFHGGVQYAYMNLNSTSTVQYFLGALNTTFNGFGPRVGADGIYRWDNGLSVFINGAAALLVGRSAFDLTIGGFLSNGAITTVTPELEAKLGAQYEVAVMRGDLSLNAGWMWVNYSNPFLVSPPAFTRSNPMSSNFSVTGPFVGVKWLGSL